MFVSGHDMFHKNIKQHLKIIERFCTHLREFCIFRRWYKVFTGKTIESFEGINCIPLKPGYFRTKRTVIVMNMDKFLM